MKSIEAVVLAGGLGSRMGAITQEKQKCLLEIDGVPALGHVVDNLVKAFGSIDLKVGVSYKGNDVKEFIDHYRPDTVDVTYVQHQLGNEIFGAYQSVRDYVHSTFLGTPGDVIAEPEAYIKAVEIFERNHPPFVTTMSPKLDEVESHGAGIIENEEVIEFLKPKSPDINPNHLRDMMVYGSDPHFFDLLDQFPSSNGTMSSVVIQAMEHGLRIGGSYYDRPWIHIAEPQDLQKTMKQPQPVYLYPDIPLAS